MIGNGALGDFEFTLAGHGGYCYSIQITLISLSNVWRSCTADGQTVVASDCLLQTKWMVGLLLFCSAAAAAAAAVLHVQRQLHIPPHLRGAAALPVGALLRCVCCRAPRNNAKQARTHCRRTVPTVAHA